MIKSIFNIFLVFCFLGAGTTLYSQGCSDAGVCSVGALGIVKVKFEKLPLAEFKLDLIEIDTSEESATNILQVDLNASEIKRKKSKHVSGYPKFIFSYLSGYGAGFNNTSIFTQQIEGMYFLNTNLSAQIKLPYQYISGNLGSNYGIGDITASLSYAIINKAKKSLNLVGGVKIPVNNSNSSKKTIPLPMVYQTSLGTHDLLFGFNYRIKTWDLTAAYQRPLNANKNEYLHNPKLGYNYNKFQESKNLLRADDAVLRINKIFNLKKASFSAGLLGIYHVTNDKYENASGQHISIDKSQGLTLNVNLSGIYPVSKKIDLLIIYANPLIIRDVRPAGLARTLVIMGGIRLKTF